MRGHTDGKLHFIPACLNMTPTRKLSDVSSWEKAFNKTKPALIDTPSCLGGVWRPGWKTWQTVGDKRRLFEAGYVTKCQTCWRKTKLHSRRPRFLPRTVIGVSVIRRLPPSNYESRSSEYSIAGLQTTSRNAAAMAGDTAPKLQLTTNLFTHEFKMAI